MAGANGGASNGAANGSASLTLPPAGTSPSNARRFVTNQLREWELPQCEYSAVLLVSELVTNALLHARTDMVVALTHNDATVLLEVTDGSAQQPIQRRYSVDAGTGRGLGLVATLAVDWGVRGHDGGGKTVWAALTTAEEVDGVAGFANADSAAAL